MYKKNGKRILDLIFSLLLLVLLAIPMLVIMVVIKIDSKGPVLFRQERFGLNSKKFVLYKFRTMKVESPIVSNQEFSSRDSYITKSGKVLREFSLDEIPQLFNILQGRMSFIGPRPLADTDMKVIKMREASGANKVLPGISGLAQINGRNEITDQKKAEYDAEYANNLSFVHDLKILLFTFLKVYRKEGINRQKG